MVSGSSVPRSRVFGSGANSALRRDFTTSSRGRPSLVGSLTTTVPARHSLPRVLRKPGRRALAFSSVSSQSLATKRRSRRCASLKVKGGPSPRAAAAHCCANLRNAAGVRIPSWPAQNSRNMGPWMEEHAEQFCSAWNCKARAGRRPNTSPSEGQRPGRRKARGWFSRPNGPTGLLRRLVGPLARKTTFSWPSRSRALPFAGRPDARSGLTCASTEQIWNKLPSVPPLHFCAGQSRPRFRGPIGPTPLRLPQAGSLQGGIAALLSCSTPNRSA